MRQNPNETSHTQFQTDESCASAHMSQIKSKTVMSWSSRQDKECIFSNAYFVPRNFFEHLCFISIYSIYAFAYQQTLLYTLLLLVLKIFEGLQCILKKMKNIIAKVLIDTFYLTSKNLRENLMLDYIAI